MNYLMLVKTANIKILKIQFFVYFIYFGWEWCYKILAIRFMHNRQKRIKF